MMREAAAQLQNFNAAAAEWLPRYAWVGVGSWGQLLVTAERARAVCRARLVSCTGVSSRVYAICTAGGHCAHDRARRLERRVSGVVLRGET